ncbi:hypothetical protein Tco_0471454 [Tanacetum coccineum]
MEPLDTLLMGDEVISTTPARENDEFIKSSIDDIVPIPRKSEVTSDSNLECDMPVNIPLPTTDSGEKTRVMETPSFDFHHMPSPRPAAYSPKEVMYRYYHPHLTSGNGFDLEIKRIVKIEDDDLCLLETPNLLVFRS